MKSKFKKLLATALVLCLVLALLPAAAFADGGDDTPVDPQTGTQYYLKAEFVGTATGTTQAFFSGTTVVEDVGGFYANSGDTVTVWTSLSAPSASDPGLYSIIAYNTDAPATTFNPTSVGEGKYEFVMPDYNVTVKFDYRDKHTVTYDPTYISVDSTSVMEGDWVIVKPVPNIVGVTIDSIWYTYDGINKYTITPDGNGTYKFQMGTSDVTVGADVTPVVSPTSHDIIVRTNIEGGKINFESSTATVGSTVTFTVTPYTDFAINEVCYVCETTNQKKVLTGNNGSYSFPMPNDDIRLEASFTYTGQGTKYYPVTTSSNFGGTISDSGLATYGSDFTVKIEPYNGYSLKSIKVNGWDYTGMVEWHTNWWGYKYGILTFEVYGDTDVVVEFKEDAQPGYGAYYIDTSYDSTLGGVEVWVNNNYTGNNWHQGSWADYQDTVSFKVKPYYSDDVVSVSVVGKRTGWTYSYDYNSYSGWYTFSMPSEDVTISVDFRSGVHKVYVDTVTDGKLTVSDDWAKYGQIVYITAVPDYGCTLSSLSVRTATGDSVRVYNAQKADTYYFYMPDQYVSVSAVFTGKYTSLPFNDVSYGDWYYNAVQFVYSRGIMDGVDYYKFAPNGTITRGMILTMLWRMAGEPFEMPVTSFTDVEIGRYYTTAVAWACRNGIADGMGETKFGPNDAITREELVTLMYRYAQYFGHSCIGTSIEGFADAGSVSSYAYNAMCWAYKAGVVTGTTGSRLNPQGTASRAEAAQMIMSFYSFLNS